MTERERLIRQNEECYGQEIRSRYGDEQIDQSNTCFLNLSEESYETMQLLGEEINGRLKSAVEQGLPPHSPECRAIAAMHQKWLSYAWPQYTPQAHAGLVQMYVDDPRFTAYYDSEVAGCAMLLRDSVLAMLQQEEALQG